MKISDNCDFSICSIIPTAQYLWNAILVHIIKKKNADKIFPKMINWPINI